MATSIEDLYQQYAGRASDPEGLAYWTRDFGDTIDANEISIFQNAVAAARAQGTEPAAQPALTASQIANTPGMGVTGIGTSNFAVPAVSDQAVTSWLQSNPGASDATIAAAMNQFGVTPDQMARVTGLDTGAVQARYDAALPAAATPTTGALTQTTTAAPASAAPDYEQMVRDAYGSIGRTGIGTEASNIDQAGFDNWVNALKSGSINPADLSNTFKSSVADYLVANPADQYSTYVANYLQSTDNPEIAGIEQLYQDVLGRQADPSGLGTWYKKFGSEISPEERAEFEQSAMAEKYSNTPESIYSVYKSIYGVEPDLNTVAQLTSKFGPTFDANEIRDLVVNDTSLRDDPRGVVKTLQQQILDQGTTKYWTGEAFGSAEKTAADMARMLATAGITDINQFGKVTVPADAAVTPVYGIRKAFDPEYGEYDQQYITGYTDANGKAVDPSLVRAEYDDSGVTGFLAPVGTKEVFGNKETGVALDPRYDRAQGNIFSGTFAGKGSTGYGVQFKEDGTPVFYTQYGGSTNTLNQIMSDLGPLGQIAFAVATGGLSIPQQIAAQAALSLASGTDLKDIVKNIAVSTVMQGLPTSGVIKDGVSFLNKIDGSGVLGNAFASAASSGTKAALTGQDIGDAILSGAVGGGTAGAIDLMASGIEGFNDLSSSQQNMVKNAISGVVSGQPLDQVLINTAIQAGKNAINTAVDSVSGSGGADDGSAAFIAAKGAGADDDEAMAAANTVTGVQINPIDAGGPNLSTSTTYDPRVNTVDSNFGDLQGAIEANAMDDAVRTDKLNVISQTPKFSDAYAQARSLLGPDQTFTWNGKQYSTATAQERPDLSAPKVQPATDESAAETARLNRQNTALVTGNAPDQSAAETARFKSMEKTGFFEGLYKDLNDKFKLQGEAANEYLKNNPNSPITASVSSAFEAAGELQKNLGGVALAFNNKPLADAIISGGSKLQTLGQSLGDAPQDTKNWNDTLALIDKAKGTEKLAVLAGRIMDGKSGLARQVGLELRQEIPALFLGGGLLRPTMIASGLIDTADTGGAAVVEAYDNAVKKGKTHQEALSEGRKAGTAAAATEAAIQLTLGKLADVAGGKLDNVISKGSAKIAGEGVVEGAQEAGASAAVDVALGRAIDVNKALTQGVAGAAVGKGTATATSPVDAAQTITPVDTTAATNISSNISTAINSGNTQNIAPVITESVTSSLNSGADANVVINSAITSGLSGGADPVVVVDNTITSAINAGAPVDTTIGSAISSAVNAGADVNVVIDAATKAANSTGNDVTIASDANTVTINNATANTGTTVDTITGSTVTVNNTTNDTTIVDPASNTTTQVSFDGNTQTTVIKDQANNTETVIKTDTNTGEVLEQSETQSPPSGTTTTGQPAAPDQAVLEGIVADQVGSLESRMNDAIARAENAGIERDQAIQVAVDSVAKDLGLTRSEVISQLGTTESTLRSEFGAGISGLESQMRDQYNSLTAEQKTLADALTNQGADLKTAIESAKQETQKQVQEQIQGVSEDVRAKYDALSEQQKTLADSLTNQGVDLRSAIDTAQKQTQEQLQGVTQDFQTKYQNLSTQQKILADSLIEQGVNVNQAINTAQSVLQGQITKVSADVKTQYNELSSNQKDLADALVEQGVELKDAIEFVKESLEKSFTKRQDALEKALRLQGGQTQAMGVFGPEIGLGLSSAALASRETQKSIDPLARVKQAQAEFEKEVMMNQIDPRLLSVMQQRMDPQQQTKQFDSDIGALAKLLSGDTQAPSNEGKYYSYGSEDSIDDILGGRAANYKEGGFVEPLKASGGAMAMPLLAKSGGALSHYGGREDYKGGKHVAGDGDGQSDDIPAWLADGEYVLDAELVSALGNGSTKAGVELLDEFRRQIRSHKRGGSLNSIPPKSKSPLSYLRSAEKSLKKK